jgi:hypothetical protein
MMNKGLWVALLVALLAAGCHGGGNTLINDQNAPGIADATTTLAANDARMPVDDNPQAAGVEGVVKVKGFTILDPADTGEPGSGTSAVVGQVGDFQLLVRLVDPEDDILSATNPDVGGRFEMEYTGPVVNAKLEVQFAVAEDLDGDGTGGDTLRHSVPVGLRPGRVAQVNLTLSRQTADTPMGAPFPSVVDLELYPESGELMIASYTGQDGNGFHNEFYGINFADGRTVFDTDGDQFLEPGDDVVGRDADTDGWIDSYESDFGASAEPQTIAGVVTNVSRANRTLTLTSVEDGTRQVLVDPFTPIEPFTEANEFYGELPLDTGLIGRQVQVFGLPAPDGFLALWIVVLPDEPPEPPGR